MELLNFVRRRGRPLIHITSTNTDIVEGQSHTITCSISSISDITGITWNKTSATGGKIAIVVGEDGKFSGGTLSDHSLTINNIAKSDEGTYVCIANNRFGKTSSEDSVLTCKECFEVEITQKGPITIGYGGTIKINANIISNSTGSLQVKWQKIHNNCSTTLRINCLRYSGSACDVNNPQLVINNVDREDAGIYKLEVISPTETKSSPGILLELHGDEADSLSKDENNFFRLYFLCQKIATKAVRVFFDSKVPGLDSFLKQHKSNLISERSVYRCTKDQEAKLFPGGQVVVVSTDFDFTLLYKLIRNLLTAIPAPTCGWGNQPLLRHLNEADDIEIIRHLRNNLAHNSDFEICDKDFSTQWTDLSQSIDRLSKGSLSTDVESIRTKSFDKCIRNEMEKDIRKELKEMREELMELQRNFNTRHIPVNIQKGYVELIKNWRIEDKVFYDETGGFTAVLNMVKSKNYMTIIGGPGSGKTATARHIALQLEEQGWEVVPVCGLEEIVQYGDRDHKQVFVLDDVLGIFAVDMNIYNRIINHKEQIFKSIGYASKLLFTCRKSLYMEACKLELFVTENIVDLQSKDNQLIETEKMAICQYHCKSKGVSPYFYTFLSFTKANHMFPFLCKLFSMEKQYQCLGERFFNKPFDYFIKELDKLQHIYPIQYAVLVLCLVNGGKLSVECLPPKCMQNDVFNNCGINLGTPDKIINDAIYHLSETYFTKLETEYTFTNDFIFEAIAYHYGRQNQHQILKYLSSSYIAYKVTLYEQTSNEDLCIHLSEDMYLPLAERLYKDIQSMNLFDVFMNKSLKHGPFRDVFEGMLKTKPFVEFELLILRKRQNIQHFVNTTFSVKKPNQQKIDVNDRDRLHLLFGSIYHVSHTRYNVRVISWIIYYGHTHLLQEIANHVECNNHNISLVFGSDVMENTRLLLLGCYSNTLDIVELILKYIDPKCINMDFASSFVSNRLGNVTPLILACTIGNLCIVKALLRNHADVNKCNKRNTSPLYIVSMLGHCDVVKCLLSSGADINLCDEDGQSPLYIASEDRHCDVVKCLLSSGADINLCSKRGQSPLYIASEEGKCDVVKFLLSAGPDINLCDKRGQSSLHIASAKRHCDVVKCLLSSGADINFCDKQGQSPLFLASKNGHCDVVKCLLSSGADINLRDKYGRSPSFLPSMYGRCDVVQCLLSSGADINLRDDDGQSPLFAASAKGHCDVVKCLLCSGADINLCDKRGQSPLYIASTFGKCDVVKYLLNAGADINLCDKRGQSPLFLPSMYGRCDVVKCLLSAGADINLCDQREQSPLFIASQKGQCDVVKCLLSSGADIHLRDDNGQSPLSGASARGHCDVVKCLLSSGVEINLRDKFRQSPLLLASKYGRFYVVKCLLNSGADVNLCNGIGQSPLFAASMFGYCDVVKCLLSSGADINMYDGIGQSPLSVASRKGQCGIVKCLLNSGADVNLRDEDGQSPLFVASEEGHCYVVKRLLSSGADINLRNKRGQSPLFRATMYGQCDVVKCLLSSGAEINLCDEDGESPLFIASQKGRCDVVKCLLSSGADMNLRNKRGHSPLYIASEEGHCDVVKGLLSSGAEIHLCDEDGESPLFIASQKGRCDVVKCLLIFGADINLRNKRGQSPLYIASKTGKCRVVKCLLSSGADLSLVK